MGHLLKKKPTPTTPQTPITPDMPGFVPVAPLPPTPTPTPKPTPKPQGQWPVNTIVNPNGTYSVGIGNDTPDTLSFSEYQALTPTPEAGTVTPKVMALARKLSANFPNDRRLAALQFDLNREVSQQRQEEIAREIGLLGILPPEEPLPPEQSALGEAAKKAAIAAGTTAAAAAPVALGATVGTAGTAAPFAAAGAGLSIAAAAGGMFAYTLYSAGAKGRKQTVREASTEFNTAQNGIITIKNNINAGKISSQDARIAINDQLRRIRDAERILKRETKRSNDKFTGQAGDELIRVTSFYELYSTAGTRDMAFLKQEIAQAMTAPDPTKIIQISGNIPEPPEEL